MFGPNIPIISQEMEGKSGVRGVVQRSPIPVDWRLDREIHPFEVSPLQPGLDSGIKSLIPVGPAAPVTDLMTVFIG